MIRRPSARTVARLGHGIVIVSIALIAWRTYDLMSSYEPGFNDPHGYTVVFGAVFLAILVPLLALGGLGFARAWRRGRSVPLELFDLAVLLVAAIFLKSGIESATWSGAIDTGLVPIIVATALLMLVVVGSLAAGRRAASPRG